MAEWILSPTIEADIDAALKRAKTLPPQSRALSAEYNRALDIIILKIDNGSSLTIPREQLQGLENATESQLAHIEIFGGNDIAWPDLYVDHYLPHLLEGKYSTERRKQARKHQSAAA